MACALPIKSSAITKMVPGSGLCPASAGFRHPSMSVDLMLPGRGQGRPDAGTEKVRINSSSLDRHLVILADQVLEIGAIAKITIRPGSGVSLLAQP
jgi:hypothetical protein